MVSERVQKIETRIGELLDQRRLDDAARAAIEGYGPEILGFLVTLQGNEADAREIFSQFCEDLWRGLGAFRRESSVRTWSYRIARHALYHFARDPYRRRGRRLETEEISALAASVTSQVSAERNHHRLAEARAVLDAEDQALLVLRIDRGLGWSDVAVILSEDDEPLDDAVLRKRFERIKGRLRQLIAAR